MNFTFASVRWTDRDERLYLDQDVQLSSPPLVQRRHALTDQRAEVMTQLEDLVQAVEHLRTEAFIK